MEMQWAADLESADSAVRSLALQKLKELGPEARAAVPALTAALEKAGDDRAWAGAVAETLGAIGPDARAAVPLLVARVNPDGGALYLGASPTFPRAVLQIGGEPAQERFALRGLLMLSAGNWKESEPFDLWVFEGGLLRQRADRVVPGLAALLTDPDEYVRARAAETLTGYGSQAASFVPTLLAALNTPWPRVCTAVAGLLVSVEPGRKPEAIAALLPHLTSPEFLSSHHVIRGLCETLRKCGEDPVPHLLSLLRRHTGDAQLPYLCALAHSGGRSIPPLRRELRGAGVAERLGAARALGLLAAPGWRGALWFCDVPEARSGGVFEDLVAALSDADAEVRGAAAHALVEIDAARAGPALPTLIARLESPDASVRGAVVQLLVRMGPVAEPALPALTRLLTDPEVRLEAALALVEINARQAAPAVPVLAEALARFDPAEPASFPWTALAALGRIGTPAAEAAPQVRQLLQAQDVDFRFQAACTLARIAPGWTAAQQDVVNAILPVLLDPILADNLVMSDDGAAFWGALSTLADIGPLAGGVVPWLEEMIFDEARRGLADVLWTGEPGGPVVLLFSALVRIDPAAAARLLRDPRAGGQWDLLIQALGRLGPAARPLAPVLRELLPETTPDRADRLKAVLAGIE